MSHTPAVCYVVNDCVDSDWHARMSVASDMCGVRVVRMNGRVAVSVQ